MKTQGARQITLYAEERTGALFGDDVTEVRSVTSYEPVSQLYMPPGYGNIAIYAGQSVEFMGSASAGTPFQIDLRLYQGRADCLWDSVPVAAGPAIFPTGSAAIKPGSVDREGLLFQVDGAHARCFLLYGRVRGLSAGVKLPLGVEILPRTFGPPMRTTVGSFLG